MILNQALIDDKEGQVLGSYKQKGSRGKSSGSCREDRSNKMRISYHDEDTL